VVEHAEVIERLSLSVLVKNTQERMPHQATQQE